MAPGSQDDLLSPEELEEKGRQIAREFMASLYKRAEDEGIPKEEFIRYLSENEVMLNHLFNEFMDKKEKNQ